MLLLYRPWIVMVPGFTNRKIGNNHKLVSLLLYQLLPFLVGKPPPPPLSPSAQFFMTINRTPTHIPFVKWVRSSPD